MDIFGIILNSFNLFTPIWMAFGILLGVFIYMFLSQPKKNIVEKVNINGEYGYDYSIDHETPFGIFCKGMKNQPPQRFFKYMPSKLIYYNDWKGKTQSLIRWLAIEGTAFTQVLKAPTTEEGQVKLPDSTTLVDALKLLWTEKFWLTVPAEKRKTVEDAKIGITVALAKKDLPDWKGPDGKQSPLVSLTEDNTMQELDREAAETDWQGKKSALKGSMLNYIFAMGAGGCVVFGVALLLGWIQLAPRTSPTAPTQGFIWWLLSHVQ